MKAVQVVLDEDLLKKLDSDPEVKRHGRSAVLRRAATEYLKRGRKRRIAEAVDRARTTHERVDHRVRHDLGILRAVARAEHVIPDRSIPAFDRGADPAIRQPRARERGRAEIDALAKCGGKVGIIDADIYGPNVPIMLGIKTQLTTDGQKIVPAEKFGLQVISMGFLTADDAPIIWRGPMLHGALQQFFREVAWTNLDYLIIDLPPGTGDVALSLSQTVPVAGAIVVTTPQQVSLADTRRAIAMYKKLNIPPLGIIENMSYFVCGNCHHEADIFGHGGGEQMAADFGIPFLGRIPIYQPIREGSDAGVPLMISEPESPSGKAFMAAAERTAAQVSIASYNRPTIQLTVVK